MTQALPTINEWRRLLGYLTPREKGKLDSLLAAQRLSDARRFLQHFTTFTYPQYTVDPFHALLADALDSVVAGDSTRLMVFAPPQHGKSELVSVRLPAYWLGRRPDDPVILASYAASLAERHSGEARQVVESIEYRRLFPGITTRRDSRAIDHWRIGGHLGGLIAVGVGGPVTGHGGLLGLIDDPFENWAQAQSQTIRDKVWDWWRGTFRPRIWENGAIILVCTRWHEDDLAGRLLNEQGDRWTVLRLPALAETQADRDIIAKRQHLPMGKSDPLGREPGQPLAPQRFSKAALQAIRGDVGEMVWSAEYQGFPTVPEGNWFKRHYFPIMDAPPATVTGRVRYWDRAYTEGGGKYTVGVLMSRTPQGVYVVEDVRREQLGVDQRKALMKQTAYLDRLRYGYVPIHIEQEPSSGKETVNDDIRQLAGFTVFADRPEGDKGMRLMPFLSQAKSGNTQLVAGSWNEAYLDELAAIPNGTYWDQADASSGAFKMLAAGVGNASQSSYLRQ